VNERAVVRLLIAVTITAAAVRLLAILGLHPLNWDEIEFFRATDWVRQGLVPYRDFWEHHTPLQWYLFAPFEAMTSSPGAAAIVWMRVESGHAAIARRPPQLRPRRGPPPWRPRANAPGRARSPAPERFPPGGRTVEKRPEPRRRWR